HGCDPHRQGALRAPTDRGSVRPGHDVHRWWPRDRRDLRADVTAMTNSRRLHRAGTEGGFVLRRWTSLGTSVPRSRAAIGVQRLDRGGVPEPGLDGLDAL